MIKEYEFTGTLDKKTAKMVSYLPQSDRMEFLVDLLDACIEDDLDKKLISMIVEGHSPENIYDVDVDLLTGDIYTAYNKYCHIKFFDGTAKKITCKKCGKVIEIKYSKLMRMKSMAAKHGDFSIQSTCDECKEKKKEKSNTMKETKKPVGKKETKKPVAKKPAFKPEVKIAVPKKIENTAPVVKTDAPISTKDILADALKEVKACTSVSNKERKHAVTATSNKSKTRRVSIHDNIAPMRGNTLGNLLKDIKI